MLNFLFNLLLSGLAVFLSSKFLPGVHITDFMSSIIVAFLLGIANSVVRPLLLLLTFPINFLTLGIFTFVINALMILLVDSLVGAFTVDNFWWAVIFSFVLSIISAILHSVFPTKKDKQIQNS
jgi:putative membrane protein